MRAEVSMTFLKVHITALVRQVNEAVRIIITKAEWVNPSKRGGMDGVFQGLAGKL